MDGGLSIAQIAATDYTLAMKHIPEDTLVDLQTALEAELAALQEELGDHATKEENGEWDASSKTEGEEADSGDTADNIEELVTNVPLVADLKIREREIKAALEKIALGTYGKCNVCGKEIDIDRLEANPAAVTCIEHTK